jgi:rfaE bifunctional protein nucleotidyltransferase chain/domain
LTQLTQAEPGAIYQVRVGFRQSYLFYMCDSESVSTVDQQLTGEWELPEYGEASNWDSYEEYYYGDDYDWQQRDNPCHPSYYTGDRNIRKNVLASDLGVLAKRGGDDKTIVFVNDLKTTLPRTGVELTVYDYQQQVIGSATTDGEGKAVIESDEMPFVLIAADGEQRGYLKLSDGESLSISNFDVGGKRVDRGIKGFLYGERGVWRPGDSLYMMFVLEDKMKLLPPAHPVVFELRDPNGQVASRIVRSSGENGFYTFATKTTPDAPTGTWRAVVKVGGTDFAQPVRIETVRPVRTQGDRAYVLAGLAAVDAVVVFEEPTPLELVRALTPDVIVKGGDYTEASVVGGAEVIARGGRVVIVPLTAGQSTTAIIERMRESDRQ